jgi:hypothetical protein
MRHSPSLLAFAAVALAACKGEEPVDTDPITATTGNPACGETDPVVEALTITNDGMSEGDQCGGTSRPQVRIETDGHDDDGDLHYWTLRVWWDEDVDGVVDPHTAYQEVHGTAGDDCTVDDLTSAMLLCVNGNPPFATELDFGVVLIDALEHKSNGGEPIVQSFTTPDESGN